jgi:LysM repeat protein
LFGYTKNKELQITIISSFNGFAPMDSIIQGQKPVCCLAPPTNDPILFKHYKQLFEQVADKHKDVDDLRINLVEQIKEIAKTNVGISSTVNIYQIKKGDELEWIKL